MGQEGKGLLRNIGAGAGGQPEGKEQGRNRESLKDSGWHSSNSADRARNEATNGRRGGGIGMHTETGEYTSPQPLSTGVEPSKNDSWICVGD